jgi:hypothetical protein
MQTMRERIAARLAKCDWEGAEFESWRDEAKEPLLAKADAVLEELREPTEGMIEACGNGECRKWAHGAWYEMIDHARKEG